MRGLADGRHTFILTCQLNDVGAQGSVSFLFVQNSTYNAHAKKIEIVFRRPELVIESSMIIKQDQLLIIGLVITHNLVGK
jgi:hypothetical protein